MLKLVRGDTVPGGKGCLAGLTEGRKSLSGRSFFLKSRAKSKGKNNSKYKFSEIMKKQNIRREQESLNIYRNY